MSGIMAAICYIVELGGLRLRCYNGPKVGPYNTQAPRFIGHQTIAIVPAELSTGLDDTQIIPNEHLKLG